MRRRWKDTLSACIAWAAVLFMGGVVINSLTAEAKNVDIWLGGEGGGVIDHDSLKTAADKDTIGPFNISECAAIKLSCQWYGDSAMVAIQTSIDNSKWYTISALAGAVAGYDSVGWYYKKMVNQWSDSTTGIVTPIFGDYVRMIVTNANAATPGDTVSSIRGVVRCVR